MCFIGVQFWKVKYLGIILRIEASPSALGCFWYLFSTTDGLVPSRATILDIDGVFLFFEFYPTTHLNLSFSPLFALFQRINILFTGGKRKL